MTFSDSKSQKEMNDILTFTLPFIATLVIGIAVIPDFIFLPLAITAALIADILSLLVSWTEEKKAHQKSKRDAIEKKLVGSSPISSKVFNSFMRLPCGINLFML